MKRRVVPSQSSFRLERLVQAKCRVCDRWALLVVQLSTDSFEPPNQPRPPVAAYQSAAHPLRFDAPGIDLQFASVAPAVSHLAVPPM